MGLLAALAIASVAVGASAQNPTYDLKTLGGSVTADGSSTVGPYTTAAAELFSRAGASKVKVTVGISGTGGGFQRFCKGETDLSNASRPMRISEAQACKTNNVGSWRAFTVANDALTVVVNQQNSWATCLSVAELKKIWEPGSKVDNWKDVRSGFPDVPIKLFGPGTDSGTFEYFTEAINGRARASRTDYQASEDDNVLVQGVSGERGGMGYFGYSYYTENRSRLNAAPDPQSEDGSVRHAGRRSRFTRARTSRSRGRSSSMRRGPPSSARKCRPSSTTSSTTRSRSQRARGSSRSRRCS